MNRRKKSSRRVDVRVDITLHVREEDVDKLGAMARERGMGYGDPGRVELVRRLAVDGIQEAYGDLNQDGEAVRYTLNR